MKKVFNIVWPILLVMFLFVPMAFGQPVNPVEDLGGFFEALYAKMKSSEWMVVFGMGLIGLVQLLKRALPWGAKLLGLNWVSRWLETTLGKFVIAAGSALGMTIGTALAAGEGLSLSLLSIAVAAAWAAGGGWENHKIVTGKLT